MVQIPQVRRGRDWVVLGHILRSYRANARANNHDRRESPPKAILIILRMCCRSLLRAGCAEAATRGQMLNAPTATNATMHIPVIKTAIAPGS